MSAAPASRHVGNTQSLGPSANIDPTTVEAHTALLLQGSQTAVDLPDEEHPAVERAYLGIGQRRIVRRRDVAPLVEGSDDVGIVENALVGGGHGLGRCRRGRQNSRAFR
jgi:hypothetical protein